MGATTPGAIERYKERHRRNNRLRYASLREAVDEYKAERGCKRCGNKDPRVLEFHHRDPKQKEFNMATMGQTYAKMKVEMEKCDVVCANCHAIIEWERKHGA